MFQCFSLMPNSNLLEACKHALSGKTQTLMSIHGLRCTCAWYLLDVIHASTCILSYNNRSQPGLTLGCFGIHHQSERAGLLASWRTPSAPVPQMPKKGEAASVHTMNEKYFQTESCLCRVGMAHVIAQIGGTPMLHSCCKQLL